MCARRSSARKMEIVTILQEFVYTIGLSVCLPVSAIRSLNDKLRFEHEASNAHNEEPNTRINKVLNALPLHADNDGEGIMKSAVQVDNGACYWYLELPHEVGS